MPKPLLSPAAICATFTHSHARAHKSLNTATHPPPPPAATCGFLYRALLTRNITAPPLLPPLPATLPPAPAFSQLSAAALAHTAVCVPSGARISPEGCAVAVDEAKPGGERLLVQFADGLEG
eukprot:1159228-Pelagomonas_calceolata.AAC.6